MKTRIIKHTYLNQVFSIIEITDRVISSDNDGYFNVTTTIILGNTEDTFCPLSSLAGQYNKKSVDDFFDGLKINNPKLYNYFFHFKR